MVFIRIVNSRDVKTLSEGGGRIGAFVEVKVYRSGEAQSGRSDFKNLVIHATVFSPAQLRAHHHPCSPTSTPLIIQTPSNFITTAHLHGSDSTTPSAYAFSHNGTRNIRERDKMAAPAPTSRSREPPQGDEEAAAELKLGEFQDVDALTHSEAALVINALVQKRKMDRKQLSGNAE